MKKLIASLVTAVVLLSGCSADKDGDVKIDTPDKVKIDQKNKKDNGGGLFDY